LTIKEWSLNKKLEKKKSHLICSLMAASLSSVNFCLARETCGTLGTRFSSFLTSSKGSKTTPVKGLLLAPFEAQTTNPDPVFERRNEGETERFLLDREETDGNREPRLSPVAFNREKAGAALSNMIFFLLNKDEITGIEISNEEEEELKREIGVACVVCGEGESI
jgi:hypothetical protein